jgi:hypothetical protein
LFARERTPTFARAQAGVRNERDLHEEIAGPAPGDERAAGLKQGRTAIGDRLLRQAIARPRWKFQLVNDPDDETRALACWSRFWRAARAPCAPPLPRAA